METINYFPNSVIQYILAVMLQVSGLFCQIITGNWIVYVTYDMLKL